MHLILFKKRRLKKADYAFNHSEYHKAFKLCLPFVHSQNKDIAFRTNRICGLSLYKEQKHNDCIVYLEKTCKIGNYRHDWYNLAMACAWAGKLEKAETAFKNIYRTNVQLGYMYAVPISGLLFQYMKALKQNQFNDAAITRVNELKQMYVGVGKDITKQVQRGLPSYPMFLKQVESLLEADKFEAWGKEFN